MSTVFVRVNEMNCITSFPPYPLIPACLHPGILFGIAIRTKKPLALPLAPLVWKLLAGITPSSADLEEVR